MPNLKAATNSAAAAEIVCQRAQATFKYNTNLNQSWFTNFSESELAPFSLSSSLRSTVTGRFISDALLKKLALGTKIAKIFYSLAFIVIGDTRQNLRLGELELELLRLRTPGYHRECVGND